MDTRSGYAVVTTRMRSGAEESDEHNVILDIYIRHPPFFWRKAPGPRCLSTAIHLSLSNVANRWLGHILQACSLDDARRYSRVDQITYLSVWVDCCGAVPTILVIQTPS